MKRNSERERAVPESIIREKAEYIATSFESLSPIADVVEIYNNN